MRFKIDWASLIVGSFCFVLLCILGQFSKYNPLGAYIWRGDLTEGFLYLPVRGAYIILEGLIHGGAYFWNFTVISLCCAIPSLDFEGIFSS